MVRKEYFEAKRRVIRAMLEHGKTTLEIAEDFGITRQSTWLFIRRHNIDAGLNLASKSQDEYYITQRTEPATVHSDDVTLLERLANDYGVSL